MKRVTLHYPNCIIKGYLNENGEFADMDGELLTMTIAPEHVDIEPGELPEMEFKRPLEKLPIGVLELPKPVLEYMVNELDLPEEHIELLKKLNTLDLPEEQIKLLT